MHGTRVPRRGSRSGVEEVLCSLNCVAQLGIGEWARRPHSQSRVSRSCGFPDTYLELT